ncbi:MAG: hypothetical protein WDZ49_14300 [Litorilinea sp.]
MSQNILTWPRQTADRWRNNPERMAWLVLLSSFLAFVCLAIAIPLSINYFVRHATVSQEARLMPTLGTLLLYSRVGSEPVAITEPRTDVVEGNRIVALDESTQGTLGFMAVDGTDEALGSVQIYPDTAVEILRIRRPMFERSPEPFQVRLRLERGQARIFTNSGDQRGMVVELETAHGLITLPAGSYQVSVNETQTDITVRSGQALLATAPDQTLTVEQGLWAWMSADEVASAPMPAEQNLLRNGNFAQSMADTWDSYVIAEGVAPGSVRIIEREGRHVAHFVRQGEENTNTEVGIVQAIDANVNVYDSLVMQLDVKLLHQSLSGAGYLSSEFPLRWEVTYIDIYGKELRYGWGFYFRDPENENWRIENGEKIPPINWYTYQSPNLMELLADTRPARIESVRIYASGWNYQSMISEVYLLAR